MYFIGEQSASLDASAYGILINIIGCPIESPLKNHALSKPNLHDYYRRMQAEFYPELPWWHRLKDICGLDGALQ